MEKNIVIIYKSKTGFTQKYAEWLAEELGCEAIPYEKRKQADISACSLVLYGGGVYAGTMAGIKWLEGQLKEWRGKQIIVFATGSSPEDDPAVEEAIKKNFGSELWKQVKVFYLRGGLCYEKMGVKDKLMLKAFSKMLAKSGDSERAEQVSHSCDFTCREALVPLLEYVGKQTS